MRFSKTTQSFYPEEKKYPSLPADIVSVSEKDHEAAINRGAGETLDYKDGKLIIVPAPPPSLEEIKSDKISELKAACNQSIQSGYTSDALGATHTYPFKDKDQSNMVASVTDSLLPNLPAGWVTPFWCADANGDWAMRDHDQAQIQKAGSDGKAWIIAHQQKVDSLISQVNNATADTAVNAIDWSFP